VNVGVSHRCSHYIEPEKLCRHHPCGTPVCLWLYRHEKGVGQCIKLTPQETEREVAAAIPKAWHLSRSTIRQTRTALISITPEKSISLP
jgi:hypothetical protein